MSDNAHPVIEIHDPALNGDEVLQLLRRHVAERREAGAYGPDPAGLGPEELRPERYDALADGAADGFPNLYEPLVDLVAQGHLNEPEFSSTTPGIGPLVVIVRRFWNWMSTKWYVGPILQQQSDVNARAASLISDLVQRQELDASRLRQLEARVAELEERLAGKAEGGRS